MGRARLDATPGACGPVAQAPDRPPSVAATAQPRPCNIKATLRTGVLA